jgi:hypothetical protein
MSHGFTEVIEPLYFFYFKSGGNNGHFARGPTRVSGRIPTVTRRMFIGAKNVWNRSHREERHTDCMCNTSLPSVLRISIGKKGKKKLNKSDPNCYAMDTFPNLLRGEMVSDLMRVQSPIIGGSI